LFWPESFFRQNLSVGIDAKGYPQVGRIGMQVKSGWSDSLPDSAQIRIRDGRRPLRRRFAQARRGERVGIERIFYPEFEKTPQG
jgi:hypothetical protein